jgi:anti-sigma-K factor RskA
VSGMDRTDVDHVAELHTLAGPYALGALTAVERAAFEQHLAGCEACTAEVAELTEAATRLAEVTAHEPPAGLRDAVLAGIAGTPQVAAVSVPRHARLEPEDAAEPEARAEAADVPVVSRPTSAQAVRTWRSWALAASVAAVLGVGVTWAVQEQRLGDAREQVAAMQSEQARVEAVLAAGDAVSRTVDATGGGRVTVVVSPSLDDGVVLLAEMPDPGEENYQLWAITGDEPASAGVLDVGATSGTTFLDDIGDADTLGVTLEPAGGSPLPTGDVLAGVPLQA